MKKIYIVRKYVSAENLTDAIRQEKKSPIHEVFLEEEAVRDLKFTLTGNESYKPTGFEKKK